MSGNEESGSRGSEGKLREIIRGVFEGIKKIRERVGAVEGNERRGRDLGGGE